MRHFFLFLFLLVIFVSPAQAATTVTGRQQGDIQQIEAYLNNIKTLKARFVLTAHDGQQLTGQFLLKRPGKMRFQYDAPITDFIVADGLLVYYYDGQLREQSSMPISASLADFFLRPNLRLSGDLIADTPVRQNGFLSVTLRQSKNPGDGSLTLVFAEEPFALRRWRIVDAQKMITEIELFDTRTGIALGDELFKYYNPTHKEPRYNK